MGLQLDILCLYKLIILTIQIELIENAANLYKCQNWRGKKIKDKAIPNAIHTPQGRHYFHETHLLIGQNQHSII